MMAGTRAGVFYHDGYLSPWFEVLSSAAQGSPMSPMLYVLAAQPLAARPSQLQAAGVRGGWNSVARWHPYSTRPATSTPTTSLHTATVQGAAAALAHAIKPFGAASNARLSLTKCAVVAVGMHAAWASRL
jgi:hypothetical protein